MLPRVRNLLIELRDLEVARDELRVQLHLGKAEALETWELLERRFHEAQRKLDELRLVSGDALEGVTSATELLVDELREGYEKLRRLN